MPAGRSARRGLSHRGGREPWAPQKGSRLMSAADSLPLVEELIPPPEPVVALERFASRRHVLFLDSAMPHASLGRYSFLTADPFAYLQLPADGGDGLKLLEHRLCEFKTE